MPLCSCAIPLLHSLHHYPPYKNKTTNIILILKLSYRLKNNLINTLKLHLGNLYVNNKTTKQSIVFSTMSLMEICLSKQ
jgi:hypothetical protein